MKDYQEGVVSEKEELDEKIDRLVTLGAHTSIAPSSSAQFHLHEKRIFTMKAYSMALGEIINGWQRGSNDMVTGEISGQETVAAAPGCQEKLDRGKIDLKMRILKMSLNARNYHGCRLETDHIMKEVGEFYEWVTGEHQVTPPPEQTEKVVDLNATPWTISASSAANRSKPEAGKEALQDLGSSPESCLDDSISEMAKTIGEEIEKEILQDLVKEADAEHEDAEELSSSLVGDDKERSKPKTLNTHLVGIRK